MPKAATTKRHIGGSNRHDGPEIKKKTAVFKMNKELGQHLLKNPDIARRIVEKAEIRPSDIVLEVGPGTGNLTETILERAKKVIVVEMDPRMCAELVKRFQGRPVERKLEILQGDVIKMPQLPYHDICISNTPYQISSPLVFKLLNQVRPPRTSVLMFQEEFALRLVARPGESLYGRLAANSQMYANISLVMKVGRNNFRPPPQVESAVVKMMIKEPKPKIDAAEWDGLLRVVFQRPNRIVAANFKSKNVHKTLEKNYVTWLSMSGQGGEMDVDYKELVKQKVEHALTVSEVGDKRAIKCDETDFLRLLLEFNKQGIHFNGDRINDDDDKMMDA